MDGKDRKGWKTHFALFFNGFQKYPSQNPSSEKASFRVLSPARLPVPPLRPVLFYAVLNRVSTSHPAADVFLESRIPAGKGDLWITLLFVVYFTMALLKQGEPDKRLPGEGAGKEPDTRARG